MHYRVNYLDHLLYGVHGVVVENKSPIFFDLFFESRFRSGLLHYK